MRYAYTQAKSGAQAKLRKQARAANSDWIHAASMPKVGVGARNRHRRV
jgi:hypothetical protein